MGTRFLHWLGYKSYNTILRFTVTTHVVRVGGSNAKSMDFSNLPYSVLKMLLLSVQ